MSALRWKCRRRAGPPAEPLRAACEAAVPGVPGVLSVTAVLTAHQDQPEAQAAARTTITAAQAAQPPATAAPQGIPGVGQHHRGGQRQGRGGQIHRRGQSGAGRCRGWA